MTPDPSLRPKVGLGIVVVRDGKVLIGERTGNHGSGTFMLPGGHLEHGETFEEGGRREVEEECGLKNVLIKGVISLGNDRDYGKHYISIGLLAESVEGEPYDAEPEKSRNWKWYDPKDVPDNVFSPSKKILRNWINGAFYSDSPEGSDKQASSDILSK